MVGVRDRARLAALPADQVEAAAALGVGPVGDDGELLDLAAVGARLALLAGDPDRPLAWRCGSVRVATASLGTYGSAAQWRRAAPAARSIGHARSASARLAAASACSTTGRTRPLHPWRRPNPTSRLPALPTAYSGFRGRVRTG